jgi:hypothetical protein
VIDRSIAGAPRVRHVVALAVLAVLSGATLGAQEPKRPGLWQLGPVFVTPRFTASRGYDTNPTYASSGPGDSTTTIGPGLRLVYPTSRLTTTADAYLQFNDFERTFKQSWDRGGSLQTELRLGSVAVTADVDALVSDSRFTIDIDEKIRRNEWGFGAGPRVSLGERANVAVRAAQRVFRFEDESVSQTLDRDEISLLGSLSYRLTMDTTVSLISEATEIRFEKAADGSEQDRRRNYRTGLSLTFSEKASLNGNLEVGVRDFSATSIGTAYRTPYFKVGLGLPTILGIKLTGGRDTYYSQLVAVDGRNSYVLDYLNAASQRELPWNLGIRVSAQFEHIRYLQPVQGFDDLVERRYTLTAGLGVFVLEKLWVGGSVHWQRRESPIEAQTYQRRFYGFEALLAL